MANKRSPFDHLKGLESKDNRNMFKNVSNPGGTNAPLGSNLVGETQPGGYISPPAAGTGSGNMPGYTNNPSISTGNRKPIGMPPPNTPNIYSQATTQKPNVGPGTGIGGGPRPLPNQKPGSIGNMNPRDQYGPEVDADWVAPEHAGLEEQAALGMYGAGAYMADNMGSGNATYGWGEMQYNEQGNPTGSPNYGIDNMNDAYDYWAWHSENNTNSDWTSQYPTFLDWWFQNSGQSGDYYGEYPGSQSFFMDTPGNPDSGISTSQPQGGGPMGGAGDLGYGSFFAGGANEGGITNPFGEGWGPEGQNETAEPGEGSGMDPDWNPWGDECLTAYQSSGSSDNYNDFAEAMCGDF